MVALARGVDISSAQTITSWAKLAAAVDFIFVKATEGVTFTSPTWARYYKAVGDNKVLRGSYHYGQPKNDPAKEAAHYVAALKKAGFRSGFDLPPVLDIEETGGKSSAALTAWCLTFLRSVDSALKLTKPWLKTGVYLNSNYFNNELDGDKVVDGRWKWLAGWVGPTWPGDTAMPRASAAVWQFTDRIRVPGISAGVDGDVARFVDLKELAPSFFAGVNPPPVPPKPPTPKPPTPKPPTPTPPKPDPTPATETAVPRLRDPHHITTPATIKPQKLDNGKWTPVKMGEGFALNPNLGVTPCLFQYDAWLYLKGLTPGKQVQVRTWTSKAAGTHAVTDVEGTFTGRSGVHEAIATDGITAVHWSGTSQMLKRGEYLRVEVLVFQDGVTVTKAQSTAHYWKV
jgi:GH25 family lysozyme M1 (1,4-beta-N-acetylmuramidase)